MKNIVIKLINIYKKNISPIFNYLGVQCKYYPTCSEYTRQAVEKYGALKGCMLGLKRIIKCNPLSKGGYDPLK